MKKVGFWLLLLLIVFFAGFFVRSAWFHSTDKATTSSVSTKQKILYWVAPMDANYRRDKPGKSPMGMDLVPVYADGGANDGNSVKISPSVENQLGVKTALVKQKTLARDINTVGYVTVNENNIDHIHSYTEGWVKKLYVKSTGESIVKGEKLLSLFSPSLNNAQEEYLLALKSNNRNLIQAGKQKLLTLGFSNEQIKSLEKTRVVSKNIDLFANRSGIVSELNVREGKFIKPSVDLMTIDDLSSIWIIADVFARQSSWVKPGQVAIAQLSALPNKTWQGRVDYVYPELDPKTHTLRVRLIFPNPDLSLKPNMYASVAIQSQPIAHAVAIPKPALIRTGKGDRVIVALDKGRFKAVPVQVGIESKNDYQVLSGLQAGDKVVVSAQFLIDSESNLSADLARMDPMQLQSKQGLKSEEYVGMGKVQSVDLKRRTIRLHHDPIKTLNMPSMTMTLSVSPECDLKGIKANDMIHFVLIKKAKHYEIIKIHNMGQPSNAKGDQHDQAHH